MPPVHSTDSRRFHTRLRQLGQREAFRFPPSDIPAHFRKASVLIPFWLEEGSVHVLLTRRAAHLQHHAGQIAFPGGRLDPGETWHEAALREAHEEVGLDPAGVDLLGRLDDAWSGAGHHLVPIVAWLPAAPRLRANPGEVERIFTPDVAELLDTGARREQAIEHRGVRYVNQIVRWSEGEVYGLSADLLLEVLDWACGGNPSRGPIRLRELISYYANGAGDPF